MKRWSEHRIRALLLTLLLALGMSFTSVIHINVRTPELS